MSYKLNNSSLLLIIGDFCVFCFIDILYTLFLLLLGNFSDVLTVLDDEERSFFLKEMWHYYQGAQNLWLGIIYDTDSKINFVHYWLHWCLFNEHWYEVMYYRQVTKMLRFRWCFDPIWWFASSIYKLAFQGSRWESNAGRFLCDYACLGRHVAVGQLRGQIWLYLQNHNRYSKMLPWNLSVRSNQHSSDIIFLYYFKS